MDLTPRDIQDKQFHDAFRGYTHEEVDMFLDDVALSFEKIFRENQTLHHSIREIEQQLTQARATEDMLKRTLLTAQKTAEEAVEEARQKSQAMIVSSERKAQEIVATAERRSQDILAQAVSKEREIQVGLEGLKRFESEYKARLRAFIESQLRVLEEGPAIPSDLEVIQRSTAPQEVSEATPPAVEYTETAEGIRNLPDEITDLSDEGVEQTVSIPEPEPAVVPRPPDARSPGAPAGRRDDSSPPARPGEEDDEERSIKELFWGEE